MSGYLNFQVFVKPYTQEQRLKAQSEFHLWISHALAVLMLMYAGTGVLMLHGTGLPDPKTEQTREALIGAGVVPSFTVDGRDVHVTGREALRDSLLELVGSAPGVSRVYFQTAVEPAHATLRLDLSKKPYALTGFVATQDLANDVMADAGEVFPDSLIDVDITVQASALTSGWPSTLVPLFTTLRERGAGAHAEVEGGYLFISGVDDAEWEALRPWVLGAAPGLALERVDAPVAP